MTDSHEYRNRRRFRRHPGSLVAWRVDARRDEFQVRHLNLGGCFIVGKSMTGFMETFQLQVDLGESGLLEVSAMTLYHLAEGTAVTFHDPDQHARDQIQRAIETEWEARVRR